MDTTIPTRFSLPLRRLHWLMAVLVALAYLLIEQRGVFPRGSSPRAAMVQGHFWVGISVFVLVWWRLALRRRDGAPPITPPLDRWTALAAKLMHLALYAFMIVMPLLGMATAWADGKKVLIPFTDLALPALLAENEDLAHRLEDLHGSIGEAFYWVIGAHVLAALWHHLMRRDDTLKRML
ncbi:cytochrome b [Thermomonas sp. HDW16]|uniref:cytochrome b n=1 Tax=Thermomonas sp. HDW16 TaxID=2714945 RepID=UPI001409B0B0|nr:cytochrome b [Thermomonas sp. HDW16]QIL20821.1 cytochrome b [Thermomonas sp. HDW16]